MTADLNGVVLLNKPTGPTSFDVVRTVRRSLQMSRVGHAGTLDPLAEGLLVICLGEGCKLVPFLQDRAKRYEFRIALGEETETLDWEGEVTRRAPVPKLTREAVEAVLPRFTGRILQVPPIFSAVKQNGVKLYHKARLGESFTPEPREITIEGLSFVALTETSLTLTVDCGKGTYVRSLARDIAESLGTIGTVDMLRRTVCSGFRLEDALPLHTATLVEDLHEHLVQPAEALPHMPKIVIDGEQEIRVRNGNPIAPPEKPLSFDDPESPLVALLSETGGELVAVARAQENGIQPVRVMLV